MPTVITKTIAADGSGDYTTIKAFEAARPASLVTADEQWIGEGDDKGEIVDTGISQTVFNCTTDATRNTILRAKTGQGWKDKNGDAAGAYDATKGIAYRANTDHRSNGITISEPYLQIEDWQIKAARVAITAYDHDGVILDRLILEVEQGWDIADISKSGSYIKNTLAIQINAGGDGVKIANSANAINCTIVRPSSYSAAGTGVSRRYGAALVKNCAIFGFSTSIDASHSGSSSNNASDTTIGIGSSNQASKTYANQFVDTTTGSRDFRPKTGADLIDNGVTDSTHAATDLDGVSRPSGSAYDIGALEFIQGGGGGGSSGFLLLTMDDEH